MDIKLENHVLLGIKSSKSDRLYGRAVDIGIMFVLSLSFMIYFLINTTTIDAFRSELSSHIYIFIIITFLLEVILPILLHGQSFGKKMVGTLIINKNGLPASNKDLLKRGTYRTLIYALSQLAIVEIFVFVLGIGSLVLLFQSEYTQMIHDFIANTLVVNKEKYHQKQTFYQNNNIPEVGVL